MITIFKIGRLRDDNRETLRAFEAFKAAVLTYGDSDIMFMRYGEIPAAGIGRIDGVVYDVNNTKVYGIEVISSIQRIKEPVDKLVRLAEDGKIDGGLIVVLPIEDVAKDYSIEDYSGKIYMRYWKKKKVRGVIHVAERIH